MLVPIVLAVLFVGVTSRNAGPTFVTHECAPSSAGVIVSPSLSPLVSDSRLHFTAGRMYRPHRRRSPAAVVVALLLLLGGVELNPGPPSVVTATSFGLLNARSARHKAALIHDVIADQRLDVLALTETWIPSDAPDAVKLDVAPPDYSVVHRHRGPSTGQRGGGVAFIHRDSIKCKVIDVGDYTSFELLGVKIIGRQSSVIVVCVYRPPGEVTSSFTDQLSDLFDQLTLLDCQFAVVGDFNVPGVVTGQLDRRVADVFSQHGLRQHVSVATHTGGNILDLVLTSDDDVGSRLVSQLAVESVCFSDHHIVTCKLGVPPTPSVMITFSYRQLRRMDVTAFCRDIANSRLYTCDTEDVDEYAALFDAELQRVLDVHAPLRTRRRRQGQHDIRQLSDDARKAKQQRRRMERRYRRTRLESDRRLYRSACLAARDSIQRSRADHIRERLASVSGDVKSTWRTARDLLHMNHKIVHDDADCEKLVATFCRFFIDKVSMIRANLAAALQSSVRRDFATRHHTGPSLSSFEPVTTDEVHRLLAAMPCKSSPLDVLPTTLLKSCSDVFAPVIARLANLSFQAGRFPSSYKRAQVLPLLKKAGLDSTSPANYRPISNLSTASKVLERLVLARLRPHLLSSNNFSQYQSAYRTGHSTETALLEVLDGVYTAADDKQVSFLIGLDLSAAFDTVDHSILIERLRSEFGITDSALDWLRSYLGGRVQYVKLGQHQSDTVSLDVGVPQGSVLGPLLFAAYTSPVTDVIAQHGVHCHQYADDTQLRLSMSINNTAEGLAVLAACTADVRHWYMQNGLQLNPDKSEVLAIGTPTQLPTVTSTTSSVSVAGVDLPLADEMKVLGVVLDRSLSFDRHATSVVRACNFHVQAIRHIRHLLTTELAVTLACSLVLSRLDYCNAVLHGAPAGTLQKLQRVQNTAARVVLQAQRRSPSKSLLEQLHWLPVRQRINYKMAVLTYKVHTSSIPVYLSRHIRPRESARQLRSSARPLLFKPTTRTKFSDRAFRCSAPATWNSLDTDILHSSSLSVFKSRLKTYLFRQTFS
jgi:Reverse transcriptase (RNA-dependent DNA polymerase)/Endonuclease-reverse transcriptase